MARKRSEEKRRELVAVATRLFAERGFDGVSMIDLADAVGLGKPTLFHYFPSKEILYARVLGELVDLVGGAVLRAASAEGSFEERLDVLSDAITDVLGAQPDAARLMVREALDGRPIVDEKVDAQIDLVLEAARAFVLAGQQLGIADPELDPTNIIVTIIGMHFLPFALGETLASFTGGKADDPEVLRRRKVAVRTQVRRLILKRPS